MVEGICSVWFSVERSEVSEGESVFIMFISVLWIGVRSGMNDDLICVVQPAMVYPSS
jgi:hypothetical protein